MSSVFIVSLFSSKEDSKQSTNCYTCQPMYLQADHLVKDKVAEVDIRAVWASCHNNVQCTA